MSASMVVAVVVSQVVLFAARESIHAGLREAARSIVNTCRLLARWCTSTAKALQERNAEMLLEVGRNQIEHKIERELRRLDGSLTDDLTRYAGVGRDLTELTGRLQADYQECGNSPPSAGTWAEAAKAAANISELEHKGAKKMLGDIQKAAVAAEKAALREYRSATAARHKVLTRMAPAWKRVNEQLADNGKVLEKILESKAKIETYMDQFDKVRQKSGVTAHILLRSARNVFVASGLVLLVALGGAFINFQLIALPMSELVPAATRISGIPVSTVAALVLVLMEITVGFFLMDMLGITTLFPRLEALPNRTKRLILSVSIIGLFCLASVEASLAVLREHIVGAENALRESLAGTTPITEAAQSSASMIPVVGQAVLGFVLPWILALVAIPLETMFDTAGTALVSIAAPALQAAGSLVRLASYAMRSAIGVVQALYDVYIAVPLSLARMVQNLPRRPASEESRAKANPAPARPSQVRAHG
jgi:hypothetical protein